MSSMPSPAPSARPQRSRSGAGLGLGLVLVALLFILGPTVVAPLAGVALPAASETVLVVFGVALLLIGSIITTITRLYYRAQADRAFVRTGMGGPVAVIDGGALVIPVVHDVTPVSLRTMRLVVTRQGEDALLTRDYLRVNITTEFFVRVPKERNAVLNAATSLGLAAEDPDAVRNLLQDKLVSALRQVAAEMEIQDLLVNRASFIQRVSGHVETDIAHNGLKLESVTISQLDQTSRTALRAEDNIFDAQGARLITETVTQMRVESNEITLGAERKIKQEQVATNKFLYEQEVQAAAAAAERDRQITTVQAEKQQQATTATAEQTRLAGLADIERERALQVAAVQRDQSVEVANQGRERAATLARLERQQAEELAQRDMTIQIAERERMRAAAQAQQLAAEAERAQQAQAVRTVEVTAEAERRKNEQVINAQAGAEQARVEQETAARVEAYRLTTLAEARQQAAQRDAEARLVAAKAERDAQLLEVEAKRAEETIPVDVERERVAVEQARVEVLSRELATKAQHESISRDLQIALARIEAEQAVAVARAQAMAQAFANAQMQIWGDPTTLSRMTQAFLDGQGTTMKIDGFLAGVSPEVKGVAANVGTLLARYAKEQFGLDVKPEEAEQLLKQLAADQTVADPGTNGTDR